MPSAASGPFVAQPYATNAPQRFALFSSFPFFVSFPFGYTLPRINHCRRRYPEAFDDLGRANEYPLLRVQARAAEGNRLGVAPGPCWRPWIRWRQFPAKSVYELPYLRRWRQRHGHRRQGLHGRHAFHD
jgi:hypothetical protein